MHNNYTYQVSPLGFKEDGSSLDTHPMNSYTWLHPLDILIDYSQQSLPCYLLSFLLRSLGLFIQVCLSGWVEMVGKLLVVLDELLYMEVFTLLLYGLGTGLDVYCVAWEQD